MREALAMAEAALSVPGEKPFAAVVVRDGKIIGRGVNRVDTLADITAHGEIEAMRDACRHHGTDLSGCEMYTTCEPCIMCVATMELAGITRIHYAASMQSAGRVLQSIRPDFVEQYRRIRESVCAPFTNRPVPAIQQCEEESLALLAEWARRELARRN